MGSNINPYVSSSSVHEKEIYFLLVWIRVFRLEGTISKEIAVVNHTAQIVWIEQITHIIYCIGSKYHSWCSLCFTYRLYLFLSISQLFCSDFVYAWNSVSAFLNKRKNTCVVQKHFVQTLETSKKWSFHSYPQGKESHMC